MAHLRDLTPDPRNARRHNARNVGLIESALREVGASRSIVIDENGMILAGNATVEAAAAAGIENVLIVDADGETIVAVRRPGLTPDQKQRLALYDNRTAELAEWDTAVMRQLDDEGADLSRMWSDDELAVLLADDGGPVGLTDPDDVPEPPADPVTKLGDLWILGRHRLLCGDATNAADVARVVAGEHPEVCLTDPPYGIQAVTGNRGQWGGVAARYRPVANDGNNDVAKTAFRLVSAMKILVQIWWGGNHYCSVLPDSPCWIVWYKRDGNDGNDFADCELAWTNQPSRARLIHHQWNGFLKASEKGDVRIHPTQKPVALFEFCLNEYSKPDSLILDLFGGSGSTLIACEQTGRRCAMLEIDPVYCDVIVRRWEQFTGQTATIKRADLAMKAAD